MKKLSYLGICISDFTKQLELQDYKCNICNRKLLSSEHNVVADGIYENNIEIVCFRCLEYADIGKYKEILGNKIMRYELWVINEFIASFEDEESAKRFAFKYFASKDWKIKIRHIDKQ